MTDFSSANIPDGVIATTDIEKFREHLHSLNLDQLRELNWFVYGVLAPTIANNRVVPHDVVFVCAFFILVRSWLEEPSSYLTPRVINYHLDTPLLANVWHYCHDQERRQYIGEILGEMFNLLRTTFVGGNSPDFSN